MNRILVLLPCWRRPEVTEVCFMGLKRLQSDVGGIIPLVVLSPTDPDFEALQTLAVEYGFHYTAYKNNPLGEKKNYGLQVAKTFDFDYLMDLGSDNLLSTELLDAYKPLMEKEEKFFGVTTGYQMDYLTAKCYRFNGYTQETVIGAGRMMHRSILVDDMWPSKMAGMDIGSQQKIKQVHGIEPKKVTGDYVVGIKTKINLHTTLETRDLLTEVSKDEIKRLIPDLEYKKALEIIDNPDPAVF